VIDSLIHPSIDSLIETMSLTCEISGESLTSTKEEVVVTPSGHTCIKRLLLAKLVENGGMDPFETMRERALSEDQLITLQRSSSQLPPPRTQSTSLPNLLQQMQSEYDALVLELFDTRKGLEDTRRELSQALYQNDAAVRVVARLSMERDAARQELEKWNASVGDAPQTEAATEAVAVAANPEEPSKKRRRTETPGEPLKNSIPEEDLQAMVDTWGKLQPQRKPMLKTAAASAPTKEDLATYDSIDKKAYHKSTCKGLTSMESSGDLVVTAGRDKQVLVYSVSEKVVKHSFNFGTIPTCVDIYESSLVVASNAGGRVVAYSLEDGSTIGEFQVGEPVVDIRIHPTSKHICIATKTGKVMVCLVEEKSIHNIAEFTSDESVEYTCGALHPDGLIYAAGTKNGQIHMWDFKNKVLASTLEVSGTCCCVWNAREYVNAHSL
jgi:pre-mRNA-processing factor 19